MDYNVSWESCAIPQCESQFSRSFCNNSNNQYSIADSLLEHHFKFDKIASKTKNLLRNAQCALEIEKRVSVSSASSNCINPCQQTTYSYTVDKKEWPTNVAYAKPVLAKHITVSQLASTYIYCLDMVTASSFYVRYV